MDLLQVLAQADWMRAARFWLLIAAGFAAWESAYHLRGALKARFGKDDNHV
jgi:hypothetical protein